MTKYDILPDPARPARKTTRFASPDHGPVYEFFNMFLTYAIFITLAVALLLGGKWVCRPQAPEAPSISDHCRAYAQNTEPREAYRPEIERLCMRVGL